MQFTIVLATLLSVASAAAITKRVPATLVTRQGGVCGPLQTPLCCQVDVLGVVNLNCANAGPVESTEEFVAKCAETGDAAQCCAVPAGADGLLCTGA